MNPILSRELRARFRDKRSFWLLFGVSALLGLAATTIYASATNLSDFVGLGGAFARQAQHSSGRELFRFLALGNTLAWLLIAPALTATGLAKEREAGLLESLWLSPFRVGAQLWGRLGAALCFLLLLQVAVLPFYSIAGLLGGVSPADVGLAALIIAMGAFCGAVFGLFCSARSYRGSSALGAAFFGVAAWGVVAFFAAREMMWSSAAPYFLATFSHPVALLWILLSPNDFAPPFGGATLPDASTALLFGLLFQLFVSLWLMRAAIAKASKPLPDMKWSEGNPRLKKWRDALEERKKERQARREAARARDQVAGALLYEVPAEKFVRFKDPLLAREVRGRFRLRQGGTLIGLMRFATFLAAAGVWMLVVFNALDTASRRDSGSLLMLALWGFGTLAVGVMSSGALVREREAGTWEGLHLSLLSPLEIVRSKWLSPLISFAYWATPFWILLPFCVDFVSFPALLVVAASLSSVSAWGFYLSSRAPHSAAATSWTLASLLALLLALPALDAILGLSVALGQFISANLFFNGSSDSISTFDMLWSSYHPFLAIGNLFNERPPFTSSGRLGIVAVNVVFNALLTAILLWQVVRRLRRNEA